MQYMVAPDFFLMGSSSTCQFPHVKRASSQDLVEIFNHAVRLESEREKVRRVPWSGSVADLEDSWWLLIGQLVT